MRIPLVLGGIPFEDKRYEPYFSEEMLKGAKAAGTGNAPWISLSDGRVMTQTSAMARYCATRAGMTPADPFAASKVDEIMQSLTDCTESQKALFLSSTADTTLEEMTAAVERWRAGDGAKWFGYFEKRLEENGDGGLFVGSSLTIADIGMWRLTDSLMNADQPARNFNDAMVPEAWLAKYYPRVLRHYEIIDAHPRIRAYMAEKYPDGQGEHPMPGTEYEAFIRLKPGHWWFLSVTKPAKPEWVDFWAQRGEKRGEKRGGALLEKSVLRSEAVQVKSQCREPLR